MRRVLVVLLVVLLAGCMMWKPGRIVQKKPPTLRPAAQTSRDPESPNSASVVCESACAQPKLNLARHPL